MLILTRRVGETLRIGSEVSVTVLGMRGRQVRIGVTAPKSLAVHREELYLRLRCEPEVRELRKLTVARPERMRGTR